MKRKERYATAILLTSFIFFLGIVIGSEVTSSKTKDLQNRVQNDVLDMQGLELELAIVKEMNSTSLCDYINYRLPEIIKRKVELGRKFDVGGFPKEEAELLQKQYVISLARYWLFYDLQEKQCNIKKPKILFFFSNEELSREQGKTLDYLVYKSNEEITVFAFNTQFNESLIRLLVSAYNVAEMPTLIIEGKKYDGFQSKEKISEILCKDYNITFC